MRRNIGLVLSGLGAFLIVLAVVLPTWIVGQVVKFPLNEYQTATLAASNASYFSATSLTEKTGVNLQATYTIKGDGKVESIVLGRNELVADDAGRVSAKDTGEREELPAQLVIRAVGYRGVPTPGLPFDEKNGTIPHASGRVEGSRNEYVVGWIKRGPTGVIGSNKSDSQETVNTLVGDLGGAKLADFADNHGEALGLLRRNPALDAPDLQILFVDVPLSPLPGPEQGYALMVSLMVPRSRGSVQLRDADPRTAPVLDPTYFSHPGDIHVLVAGV